MSKPLIAWLYAFKPAAVFGLLRRRLAKGNRLDALLGVEIVSVGSGVCEARLAKSRKISGAEGFVQRAAVYALADAASNGAMSGAFAPMLNDIRASAATAAVTFHADAQTDITASAMVIGSSLDLRAELKEEEKAAFDVVVDVRDAGGAEVAQIIFAWRAVKAPPPAAPEPEPEAAPTPPV